MSTIIYPSNAWPSNGARLYPEVHQNGGFRFECYAVEASLGADVFQWLQFPIPNPVPSGTMKLVLQCFANATSGSIKYNPQWIFLAEGDHWDQNGNYLAETTQTETWAAGEANDLKLLKTVLDADIYASGDELLQMKLEFETLSWSLASIFFYKPYLLWE